MLGYATSFFETVGENAVAPALYSNKAPDPSYPGSANTLLPSGPSILAGQINHLKRPGIKGILVVNGFYFDDVI